MKTFKDIKVGDIVIADDVFSHDCYRHIIQIDSIEYDKEYGMICYGTDLEEDEWGDDYMKVVTELNFVGFANLKDNGSN